MSREKALPRQGSFRAEADSWGSVVVRQQLSARSRLGARRASFAFIGQAHVQGLIKSFPSLFGGRPREVIGSRSCSKAEGEYIEVRPSVVVQICKGAKHHPYSPLYFAADWLFCAQQSRHSTTAIR